MHNGSGGLAVSSKNQQVKNRLKSMENEKHNIRSYTDTWGGKNYGCYPINTPGQILKEKLDASNLWNLVKMDKHVDERNDNQCDIHRGSNYTYKHNSTSNIINVYMTKSRSGKTINWEFHTYFNGNIEL